MQQQNQTQKTHTHKLIKNITKKQTILLFIRLKQMQTMSEANQR